MAGKVVFDTISSAARLLKRLARSVKVGYGKSIRMSRSTRRRNGKLPRRLRTIGSNSNRNIPTTQTINTHTATLRLLRMELMLDQALTVHPTVRQLCRMWRDHLYQPHNRSLVLTTLHMHQLHQVLLLLARPTAHRAEDHMLHTLSLLDRLATLTADRLSSHRHNQASHKHQDSKAKHLRRRKVNHSKLSHNLVKRLNPHQDSLTSR